MQTVSPGDWVVSYSETENALRLFVNGWSREAVLFRITKDNVVAVMEFLDSSSTEGLVLVGQPMASQEHVLVEEGDWENDDVYEPNYDSQDEHLTKFYRGESQEYLLKFNDPRDLTILSVSIWEHWALDHLLAEAVQ